MSKRFAYALISICLLVVVAGVRAQKRPGQPAAHDAPRRSRSAAIQRLRRAAVQSIRTTQFLLADARRREDRGPGGAAKRSSRGSKAARGSGHDALLACTPGRWPGHIHAFTRLRHCVRRCARHRRFVRSLESAVQSGRSERLQRSGQLDRRATVVQWKSRRASATPTPATRRSGLPRQCIRP